MIKLETSALFVSTIASYTDTFNTLTESTADVVQVGKPS